MTKLRAVLLDIDGTLIDSNDAHAQAWIDALARFGHEVPFERVRALIGKGGDKLLVETIGVDKDSPQGKQIDEHRARRFKEAYLPHLRAFPKAREVLESMREGGLRLVVATSAKREEMNALLEICRATDLLYERTSSDDAERSKPDPDIIEAALEKAGVGADAALMLGDTPYDIEAAKKGGVRTVAVRSGGWQDPDLHGAVAIYDDAADLWARYAQSPFVKEG